MRTVGLGPFRASLVFSKKSSVSHLANAEQTASQPNPFSLVQPHGAHNGDEGGLEGRRYLRIATLSAQQHSHESGESQSFTFGHSLALFHSLCFGARARPAQLPSAHSGLAFGRNSCVLLCPKVTSSSRREMSLCCGDKAAPTLKSGADNVKWRLTNTCLQVVHACWTWRLRSYTYFIT